MVASDGTLTDTKAVTVNVTNVDEIAPVITSVATAAVNENVAAGTTVYTATATDNVDFTDKVISYSLAGTDAAAFNIDAATGVVTIKASPDYETKSSYSFNVVAADATGNSSSETVTLSINNLFEGNVITNTSAADTFTNLTIGQDLIRFDTAGDSDPVLATTSASGKPTYDSGISGFDHVTSYSLSMGDLLDLSSTTIAPNVSISNGTDTLWGATKVTGKEVDLIASHTISNGMVTFFTDNAGSTALSWSGATKLPAVVDYLQQNLTTGQTVGFTDGTNSYVFSKGASITASTFVQLDNVVANGIEIGVEGVTQAHSDYIHIV